MFPEDSNVTHFNPAIKYRIFIIDFTVSAVNIFSGVMNKFL
jgi:hypothetical protein